MASHSLKSHLQTKFMRGLALQQQGSLEKAKAIYEEILAAHPAHFGALHYLGVVASLRGQPEVAIELLERALRLDHQNPMAHHNYATALVRAKRYEAAIEHCDKAIALRPNYAATAFVRGTALLHLNQHQSAVDSYDSAITLNRDYADAHVNRSLALLVRGEFEEGWRGYEWRLRSETIQGAKATRVFSQPRWIGEERIAGKTLLLHCEQGLGDTIQFCRYAKLVAQLEAKVIIEVQRPLVSLLKSLAGVWRVVEQGESLPHFDLHCPLLSLPLAFKTSLATIPSAERYLEADAGKLSEWKARVGADSRLRVGLAWSGNKAHPNDGKRSIALAELLKGLPEEHHYVSLHKEVREADMKTLEANPQISHFAAEQTDFSDAAALCACMDLVISVDTSIAHLSAALGQQTWILLPLSADWRWLLDREDSPWYPSVKLFRQVTSAGWSHLIERVALQCRNLDYRIETANKR